MRRVLVAIGLLLWTPVRADVSASIGVGGVAGPIQWEGPAAAGFEGGDVHLEDTVLGTTVAVGAFAGQRLTTSVALGLGLDGTMVFLGGADLGHTSYGPGFQVDMTARLVIRRSFPGMVWRLGVGGAFAGFLADRSDIGAADNVAKAEFVLGPLAELAAGYNYSRNRQLVLSLRAGYLVSQHMRYIPVLLTLRLHFGAY